MFKLKSKDAANDVARPPRSLVLRRTMHVMAGVAGLLLIVGGCGFYFISAQIQAANKNEADKQAEVGSSEQIAQRYDATVTAYNESCGQLRYLENQVAPNAFVPTLLPQMQKLAESFGCSVQSIRPGALQAGPTAGAATPAATTPATAASTTASAAAAAPPEYQTMPVQMAVTGTYPQLMRLIYSLTRFPKVIALNSIALHPGAPSGGPSTAPADNVSASLAMTAYLFPQDDSQLPAVTQQAPTETKLGSITANHQIEQDVVSQGTPSAATGAPMTPSTGYSSPPAPSAASVPPAGFSGQAGTQAGYGSESAMPAANGARPGRPAGFGALTAPSAAIKM
jgi:Tfp pilus assembly protein PilO